MSTINIDFGLPGTAPDDDFSGAGSSGVWNVIDRVTFTGFEGGPILDFKGNTTSVLITTSQTMSDVSPSSQPFSPSDAPLLGDYLVGGSNTFTMSLHGLSDGWYSFVIYTTGRQDFPRSSTIIPDSDVSASKTNTGLYAGSLQEGVTHTTFVRSVDSSGMTFEISSPSDGFINGLQITQVKQPTVPEPSIGALIGLTLMIVVCRRNRRSSQFRQISSH